MTVICWDGTTLAADKRAVNSGLVRTTTKIFRVGDKLCGVAGDFAQGLAMVAWAEGGFKLDEFPESQRDKDEWATFVVIEDGKVLVYERGSHPLRFEDKHFAAGSGRDFALAAMHCGKTAAEAVEIACLFENGCGNGVDTLTLEKENG